MTTLPLARLFAAAAFCAVSASAALVNGNFDADAIGGDGSFTCSGTVGFTGWSSPGLGCGTGLFNPGAAHYPGGNAPSNDNIVYHNGAASYYQLAPETWTADVTQTFNLLIGARLDDAYLGYTMELWAGTPLAGGSTLVASQTNGVTPLPGTFLPTSLSFTPTGAETWIGQQVGVLFRGGSIAGGVQTNFDNAELTTVVPEPGTYALVGSALIGLAMIRRRCA
jgi:hypothetical protein